MLGFHSPMLNTWLMTLSLDQISLKGSGNSASYQYDCPTNQETDASMQCRLRGDRRVVYSDSLKHLPSCRIEGSR